MQRVVPCVFPDTDEVRIAVEELEAEGVEEEELVEGPARVQVGEDRSDEQFRDAALGLALGAPAFAALMVGLALLTMPSFGGLSTTAVVLVAAHGILMGLIIGGMLGGLAGFSRHQEAETEVDVGPGEVLLVAHTNDVERALEVMEAHGARCYLVDGHGGTGGDADRDGGRDDRGNGGGRRAGPPTP